MSAPVAIVRQRLHERDRRTRGRDPSFMAQCPNPAHGQGRGDRHPSLHVSEGADGRVLCRCFAGCQLAEILEPLGLEMRDLYPNRATYRHHRQRETPTHEIVIAGNCGEQIIHPPKSVPGRDVPDLDPVLADVLRALHKHAFFAPRCCPSQDIIAAETGYTRETVNRACAALRALGLITWTQRLRPGARWRHNVYSLLAFWHRPYRRAVMARLARIRRRRVRLFSSDPKSTARDVNDTEDGPIALQRASRGHGDGHERPPPTTRPHIEGEKEPAKRRRLLEIESTPTTSAFSPWSEFA
jgi:hypothetical protein